MVSCGQWRRLLPVSVREPEGNARAERSRQVDERPGIPFRTAPQVISNRPQSLPARPSSAANAGNADRIAASAFVDADRWAKVGLALVPGLAESGSKASRYIAAT